MKLRTAWQGNGTVPDQRAARLTGWLFIATFVTGIAGLIAYGPVLNHPGYVLGPGADTRIEVGALLEMLLLIANIGTAVVLFPILKRQSEAGALGYVTARLVECGFIALGLVSLLAVVTLRQDGGPNAAALVTSASSLVAIHDWTFVLGPGFVVGVGNGLILGWLMYRTGLVPRWMAMFGLIGGPLIVLSGAAVVLGAIEAGGTVQLLATVPEIVWEASLGIYLAIKGFRHVAIASGDASAPMRVPELV